MLLRGFVFANDDDDYFYYIVVVVVIVCKVEHVMELRARSVEVFDDHCYYDLMYCYYISREKYWKGIHACTVHACIHMYSTCMHTHVQYMCMYTHVLYMHAHTCTVHVQLHSTYNVHVHVHAHTCTVLLLLLAAHVMYEYGLRSGLEGKSVGHIQKEVHVSDHCVLI